jgi:hypothetical protein
VLSLELEVRDEVVIGRLDGVTRVVQLAVDALNGT